MSQQQKYKTWGGIPLCENPMKNEDFFEKVVKECLRRLKDVGHEEVYLGVCSEDGTRPITSIRHVYDEVKDE